jgi:hypothetical protein
LGVSGSTLTNTVTSNTITGIQSAPFTWNITSNYSVPSSSLGSLNFLNTTNSSLSLSPGISIGTSAFTVDGWFYPTTISNNAIIASTNSYGLSVIIQSSTQIRVDVYGQNTYALFTVPTISTNNWHYIALVRSDANLVTVFIDGVKATAVTLTNPSAYGAVNGGVVFDANNYLGAVNTVGAWSSNYYFIGQISNLRVVDGTALYDPNAASITKPSVAPIPVANTKLLLNTPSTDYYIRDFSNTQTVTNAGYVTFNSNKPSITSNYKYFIYNVTSMNDAHCVAGSYSDVGLKMDGSNDYMVTANLGYQIPSNASFTIEMWVKPNGPGNILNDWGCSSYGCHHDSWIDLISEMQYHW